MRFTSAPVLLLSTLSLAVAQSCYYPAGNIAENHVPCNPSSATSSCCSSLDRCLANGLCLTDDKSSTAVQFARGSCTDKNWGSGCFSQCAKVSHPGNPVTNIANVFRCSASSYTDAGGAKYCCETAIGQQTGCCDGGNTFWLASGGSSPKPATSKKAPAPIVALQQTSTQPSSTSTTSTSSSVVASVTTVSNSSSSFDHTSTTYALSSSIIGNGTSSAASVSGIPSPSTNGTMVSPAGPTAPGPSATGAAGRGQVVGLGALVFAGVVLVV